MTVLRHRGLLFAGGIILLILSVIESDCIADAIRASLLLSARTLIPTLLPALVLSGLLSSLAPGIRLPLQGVFSRLFHLPPVAFCPFLLGMLCGFPIGAVTAAALYQQGVIGRADAARAAAISANTGPAFCVAAVGLGMFRSARIGWWLYAIQIASALLAGFITRKASAEECRNMPEQAGISFSLSDQLYRAALTLLSVTATVSFFGALCAPIAKHAPPFLAALLYSILEVGGGSAAAATLSPALGVPFAALSISFSGVSVLLQSAAAVKPCGIPLRPLVIQKSIQGLLALLISVLLFPLFI